MKLIIGLVISILASVVTAQRLPGAKNSGFNDGSTPAGNINLTVSQIGTNSGTATPIVITVTNTWAAPGGIVLIGEMSGAGAGTITPSDSRGNSYSVATNALNTANSCQIFCDYAPITTSLQSGDTISVAYTVNGARLYVAAYYVSAMKSSGSYDVGNTNVSSFGTSGSSGTTPAVTGGGQNEAAFVAYMIVNAHTTTITAPYTQLFFSAVNTANGYGGWNQVTSGTQSKAITMSGNDVAIGLIGVFKSQ